MASRVFTVELSFIGVIPDVSVSLLLVRSLDRCTYQSRCSSHLPVYFQPLERPPAPPEGTAAPEINARRKAHGLSARRNLPGLSRKRVEIAR